MNTSLVGNVGFAIAAMIAPIAIILSVAAAKLGSARALAGVRWMLGAFTAALTLSSIALIFALINSDFSLTYVTRYTEKALPIGYRLAAFWAGQEGSLLLWAWLIAAMATVYAVLRRKDVGSEAAATLGTLFGVCGFFAILMLFAANPFKVNEVVPADGHGMNPMLQDPGMIAHPPLLFMGYAGYTIPFAMMVGALVVGRKDNLWLQPTRRWALAAWLFLTVGIVLGAQWAYVELGWGGYWAWDPVENASLLPWLTGTALLHSVMAQQQKGALKRWNAFLFAVTFVLCIFGTYITRSGVIESVHSFGKSLIGTFFMVFLLVLCAFSTVLILVRWGALKAEAELDGLLTKEGMFLATNVILVAMTALTFLGTMFPVISQLVSGQQVSVGQNYYNKVVGPLGMLLVAVMAVGPMLTYGQGAAGRLGRALSGPATLAGLVTVGLAVTGVRNAWALVGTALIVLVFANVAIELVKAVIGRIKETGEVAVVAAVRVIDGNHRRYGGQVVHLGVALMVAGILGSSLYVSSQDFSVRPGESIVFAGNQIRFEGLRDVRGPNFTSVDAALRVTDATNKAWIVRPQKKFFDKSENPSSDVAILSTWREDLYFILNGWESGGNPAAVKVIRNPLVSWIWAGAVVMTVGGLFCMLPKLIPSGAKANAKAVASSAKPAVKVAAAGAKRVATAALVAATTAALVGAGPELPKGHPTLPAKSGQQQQPGGPAGMPSMPAGHPAPAGGAKGGEMPVGHPDVGGERRAATQPSVFGRVVVKAVQGTKDGGAVAGDRVQVDTYSAFGPVGTASAALSAEGTATVENVAAGEQFHALVRVVHAGVAYAAEAQVPEKGDRSAAVEVRVYDTSAVSPAWTVAARNIVAEPATKGGGIQVTEILSVENPTDRSWLGLPDPIGGGRSTLVLTLPAGADDVTVFDGFEEGLVRWDGERVISSAALQPGVTRFRLSYVVAGKDGKAEVTAVAPVATARMWVFVPDDGSAVTGEGLEGPVAKGMAGARARVFKAEGIPANKAVKVVVPTTRPAKKGENASSSLDTRGGASVAVAPFASPRCSARLGEPARAGMMGSVLGIVGLMAFMLGGAMVFRRSPNKGCGGCGGGCGERHAGGGEEWGSR